MEARLGSVGQRRGLTDEGSEEKVTMKALSFVQG